MIKHDPQTAYEPTPEEIRTACAEIQSSWTESERRKRRYGSKRGGPQLVAPTYDARIFELN
jgi:hypothetical protein